MKKPSQAILHTSLGLIAWALLLSSASAGQSASKLHVLNRPQASARNDLRWQRINLDEEEISILAPVAPTILVQVGDKLYFEGSDEKILEKRYYSGYANGFIYGINSYKVESPGRLLIDMLGKVEPHLRFERDLKLYGFEARQYRWDRAEFQGQVYYLAASNHVYVFTLAATDKADPSIARFFSSIRLGGRKGAAKTVAPPVKARAANLAPPASQTSGAQTAEQPQIYKPSEVTRKAILVWRPEPMYTEAARDNQLSGTVVLRAVFNLSGQLSNLRVVSGLPDGLTEKAVEAAHSIRFFPAVKDGQLVSQYIQIEYNFNLY